MILSYCGDWLDEFDDPLVLLSLLLPVLLLELPDPVLLDVLEPEAEPEALPLPDELSG